MSTSKSQGFTLIEVVIATFIVGIALIALAGTVQVLSKQTSRIEETFVANLIASNTLAELQLRQEWPEVGEQSDTHEMANRDWFSETRVEATDIETLRRVEIIVGIENDTNSVSTIMVGFVSNSSQIGQRPIDWLGQNDASDNAENTEQNEGTR